MLLKETGFSFSRKARQEPPSSLQIQSIYNSHHSFFKQRSNFIFMNKIFFAFFASLLRTLRETGFSFSCEARQEPLSSLQFFPFVTSSCNRFWFLSRRATKFLSRSDTKKYFSLPGMWQSKNKFTSFSNFTFNPNFTAMLFNKFFTEY